MRRQRLRKNTGVNLHLPSYFCKKTIWLTDSGPKMSYLKLARMRLEAEVKRRLALRYRSET